MSEYEIHAIRYASLDRVRSENFIHDESHRTRDEPMPLTYFVWLVRGDGGTYVIDTGFDERGAQHRGRTIMRPVAEGLKAAGVDLKGVKDVIITHLHYDHAGNHDLFPNARYHLQASEMAYATGPCMCHHAMRHPFDVEDVQHMVKRVFEGRVCFHEGSREIAPGLSVHLVGGHSRGLQVVRVRTRRGWVVLASDAAHYYENFQASSPFPIVVDLEDMLRGYEILKSLASSPDHVVPGHDPLVLDRYPASGLGEGMVRLDVAS